MSSFSNPTPSKFEKEKQKLLQEKCQTLLNDMLRDEDNKYCVDCDAKGPRWASWNLGIFLCIRCAGIHRNLGVHISRVKSVNLDSWTPEQVVTIQQMGNSRARAVYEANIPDTLRRPQTDTALESFIRAKYEQKKYIAKEWVQPSPVKVNWDAEVEESLRKKKEVKKTTEIGPLPSPVSKPSKTSPLAVAKIPVIDVGKVVASASTLVDTKAPPPQNGQTVIPTLASDDLLGLVTDSGSTTLFHQKEISHKKDDLGSIFTSSEPSITGDSNLGKLTKESILSLYASAPTTPSPNANPFIQSGTGSAYGNLNLQGAGALGGSVTFPQVSYGYNPNSTQSQFPHQPNAFHGLQQFGQQGYGPLASASSQDISQVQNKLFGLNLESYGSKSHGNSMEQNPLGNYINPIHATQFQTQVTTNLTGPKLNSFTSMPTYQTSKADNLPGLGSSVSQLMQPNLSGSSFWK